MIKRCEQGAKKSTEQVFSPTTPCCVPNNIMSDSCERMDETDMASKISTRSPYYTTPRELCVESGSLCDSELEMSNKCEPIIMLSTRKSNITTPFKKESCEPSNMEQFLAKSIATKSPAKQNSTMPPTTPKKCSAVEEKYKKWEKSLKWNEIITQGGEMKTRLVIDRGLELTSSIRKNKGDKSDKKWTFLVVVHHQKNVYIRRKKMTCTVQKRNILLKNVVTKKP